MQTSRTVFSVRDVLYIGPNLPPHALLSPHVVTPFNVFSTSRKRAVNGRLFLRFHDVVSVGREQHALQTVALAVVSVRVFCAVAHARVCGTISFCLVFSKKFNMISALFVHQSLTLPQNIDSREGLF